MPDTFGVSLVFEAEVVFVFEDGTEIPADELSMEEQEKAVREFPSVRFRSIKSADFVDAPAANKNGLFSINTTTQKTIMAEDTGTELEQVEEAAEEVATEANPLEEKLAELEERVGSYEEKIAKLTGELSEAQSVNEKLSSFIDFGEEAIEESTDEAKPAETLVDQLSSVEGYELTKLFREQKEKIFSQFNQKRG
jgi:septal ring factor EnvC (AmiA/AmiB activator)